jgi:hypothetical protein
MLGFETGCIRVMLEIPVTTFKYVEVGLDREAMKVV